MVKFAPNVFTPRDGNDKNNGFHIMGLDPWEDDPEGVLVRIFDRWGNWCTRTQSTVTRRRYGEKSADGGTSTPSSCPTATSSRAP